VSFTREKLCWGVGSWGSGENELTKLSTGKKPNPYRYSFTPHHGLFHYSITQPFIILLMNNIQNGNSNDSKMGLSGIPQESKGMTRNSSTGSHDKIRKEASIPLPTSFRPSPNSVVIGRGNACANAKGNLRLQSIVKLNLDDFRNAQTMLEKADIITRTVNMVRDSNPRGCGAFVKRKDNGTWWEATEKEARGKVRSMLRTELKMLERRARWRSPSSSSLSSSYSSSSLEHCSMTSRNTEELTITNIAIQAPESMDQRLTAHELTPEEFMGLSTMENKDRDYDVQANKAMKSCVAGAAFQGPSAASAFFEVMHDSVTPGRRSSQDVGLQRFQEEEDSHPRSVQDWFGCWSSTPLQRDAAALSSSLPNIFEAVKNVPAGAARLVRSDSALQYDHYSLFHHHHPTSLVGSTNSDDWFGEASVALSSLLENNDALEDDVELEPFDDTPLDASNNVVEYEIKLNPFDDTPLDASFGK
jgi:hypothetical protein